MPKLMVIEPGTQFGLLTYIREGARKVLPSGQRPRVARCKCKCGRFKNVMFLHLVRGRTVSCGKCDRLRRKEIVGEKFGSLTIIKELKDKIRNGRVFRMVEAKCDCGNIIYRRLNNVRKMKSCGCLTIYLLRSTTVTHGMTGSRPYRIWQNMLNRCYNKKVPGYKRYGARGICVCNEWQESFETFYEWAVNNGYSDNLSLDRWPNKRGNYEPSNCRWATEIQQQNNKTSNTCYTYKGETKTLAELCRSLGVCYSMVNIRINKLKWGIIEALETPKLGRKVLSPIIPD